MTSKRSGLVLAAAALSWGCGAGSTPVAKQPTAPRGQPSYVRFVNLTSKAATGDIKNAFQGVDISAYEMTTVRALSPGKELLAKVAVDGKDLSSSFKTEPGKFATVVIGSNGVTSFASGKSLTTPGMGKLDYVNLTSSSIQFSADKAPAVAVPSQSSETLEYQAGSVTVSAPQAASIEVPIGPSQVWAVYAMTVNGKVVLKKINLKGTGQAAGTGASAS